MKIRSLTNDDFSVLRILSEGTYQTEEQLSIVYGNVSKAIVNNRLNSISETYNLNIIKTTGKGYKWINAINLLAGEDIKTFSSEECSKLIERIDIYGSIDSTNDVAKAEIKHLGKKPIVIVSEHQTAGRGRGDRKWISPLGQNIYYTMIYPLNHLPQNLNSLSLIVGIAVVRTLKEIGVNNPLLKWPNDVWVDKNKIAGILIESILHHNLKAPPTLIIGIGINCQMTSDEAREINIDWTDVVSHIPSNTVNRNMIIANLSSNLLDTIRVFEKLSFKPFLTEFASLDITKGKKVYLSSKIDNSSIEVGISQGVHSNGGLIIKNQAGISSIHTVGEISLKLAE